MVIDTVCTIAPVRSSPSTAPHLTEARESSALMAAEVLELTYR